MCDEVKVAPNVEMSDELRIKVFERDEFTCQQCGMSAPEVVLYAVPIDDSDADGADGMVTICSECAGVDEDSPSERELQLDMMRAWQADITMRMFDGARIVSDVVEMVSGHRLDSRYLMKMAKLVDQFGLAEVCDAARTSFSQYPFNTKEEWEFALDKIGGICYCRTHKTCVQCRKYSSNGCEKQVIRLRFDRHGGRIRYRSIKDAETCSYFEDRNGE